MNEMIPLGLSLFCGSIYFFLEQRNRRRLTSRGPNPKWKPKDVIRIPVERPNDYLTYETSRMSSSSLYGLIISVVVPRPIALITSQNSQGILNCAPFSYFGLISHDPPLVAVGICINGRNKTKKDTLNNIEETGEFVINLISAWYVEAANHTCGNFPSDVNEVEVAGLSTIPSISIVPPRLAESAVQLECKVDLYILIFKVYDILIFLL
jgi:flavin reductase (DIM6/NTAB) family NADH-FMN oxidoreductase RutF